MSHAPDHRTTVAIFGEGMSRVEVEIHRADYLSHMSCNQGFRMNPSVAIKLLGFQPSGRSVPFEECEAGRSVPFEEPEAKEIANNLTKALSWILEEKPRKL